MTMAPGRRDGTTLTHRSRASAMRRAVLTTVVTPPVRSAPPDHGTGPQEPRDDVLGADDSRALLGRGPSQRPARRPPERDPAARLVGGGPAGHTGGHLGRGRDGGGELRLLRDARPLPRHLGRHFSLRPHRRPGRDREPARGPARRGAGVHLSADQLFEFTTLPPPARPSSAGDWHSACSWRCGVP